MTKDEILWDMKDYIIKIPPLDSLEDTQIYEVVLFTLGPDYKGFWTQNLRQFLTSVLQIRDSTTKF